MALSICSLMYGSRIGWDAFENYYLFETCKVLNSMPNIEN